MLRWSALFGVMAAFLIAPAIPTASQATPPAREDNPPPTSSRPVDAKLEALFRRTLQGAETSLDATWQVLAMVAVGEARVQLGDRDEAGKNFRQAAAIAESIRPTEARLLHYVLLDVAQAQARGGFREDAIDATRKMVRIVEGPAKSERHKSDAIKRLLECQVALEDRDGIRETLRMARRFYETAENRGIGQFAEGSIVEMQARSGDLAGALWMTQDPRLFRGEFGPRRRTIALFFIVGRIGATDRIVAGPILEDALRAAEAEKDQSSRNQYLRAVAMAQVRLGRIDEALKLARAVDAENPPGGLAEPTKPQFLDSEKFARTFDFAEIGDAQAKIGDRAGARRSAEEVVRIVGTLRDERMKTTPLRRAAVILAKTGDVAQARRIVDAMTPRSGMDSCEEIAAAQREAGDEAGARETLQAALRRVPDVLRAAESLEPGARVEQYEWLAGKQHQAGDEAGARETLELAVRLLQDRLEVVAQDGKPATDSVLEGIGRLQARRGDVKGAIRTILRITDGDAKSWGLWRLAYDRAASHDLDGALEPIALMEDPKMEANALQAVVQGFFRREPAPAFGDLSL